MKKIFLKLPAKMMMVLALILVTVNFSTAAKIVGVGGEYFEVYLNDKLILQQGITATGFKVKDLPLDNVSASDKLIIHYRQCHGVIAKGRSISIKDDQGKVIKEWKFSDGDNSAMIIPVSELLQIEKQNPKTALKLCYTSTQFSENRTLASLQFKGSKTAYNH